MTEETIDSIDLPAEDTSSMIDKANAAAKRLEEGNKILDNLTRRLEQLQVENTLGGRSVAGKKELTQEEKDLEGARKLLQGTGYDDQLFPRA